MSLDKEEESKQLMTALPFPENPFLLDFLGKAWWHCQSPKPLFFLARGFLLQPQPTTKGTKGSTSLFSLSEAEIFHWGCDGWNAWRIWMRVIWIRGEVNETQETIEMPYFKGCFPTCMHIAVWVHRKTSHMKPYVWYQGRNNMQDENQIKTQQIAQCGLQAS